MELRWQVIVLLTTIICFEGAQSIVKRWNADVNVDWENSNNWFEGRVPDLDSLVSFPKEMRHAVGLPRTGNFRFSGLEFPVNGFVAFPENGHVTVSEKRNSVSLWLWEITFFWVDPVMWNVTSEAVPHLERLPCQSDVVVLPGESSIFTMRLPESRELEVQEVRLADENSSLSRWEWSNMKDRAEFLGSRFSIKYSPLKGCENCPCQEGDISDYWEEVCDVVRPRCEFTACERPMKVEGHCCHYCGGRIVLSKKALLSTARRITDRVMRSYASSIDWHSRVTSKGDNEILFAERNQYTGADVIIAIAELQAALREQSIEVLYSETSGDPLYDYRLLVALGPILGGFFVLMCLMLLMCFVFGYSYREIWEAFREVFTVLCLDTRVNGRRKKSFAFARFENVSEGNVHLAEEETPSGERFENPLYRSTKRNKGQEKKIDLQEPVTLAALQQATELNNTEEIEMDIENL